MMSLHVGAVAVVVACAVGAGSALAGCGAASSPTRAGGASPTVALPADERPISIGRGPGFAISPTSPGVARRSLLAGLACARRHRAPFGVHLELYARGLVLPVPAGIGVAPPQRRHGAYVLGGSCTYPIRTLAPTGLMLVDPGRPLTVGTLFAVWGQRLSGAALAGFNGPLAAFVDGHRWRGPVGTIPLHLHANIVIEIAGYVAPHPAYQFPAGV